MKQAHSRYAIALGSNRRHGRHGTPASVVRAAIKTIGKIGQVEAVSAVRATPALGPAGRAFANAALLLSTSIFPDRLIAELKAIERAFGRRPGRRWGPRVLDLDLLLWSGGPWTSPSLTIPHPAFRERRFVLDPLAEIAPGWRDPVTGATVRQLLHRLRTSRAVDPNRAGP